MRSAVPSLRSYSFVLFGFCLLLLFFGYRSLHSSGREDMASDYYTEAEGSAEKKTSEDLSKLLQTRCNAQKLERIGEYAVCSAKSLNRERSCLIFSVATETDLKFESRLSEQMDKCKVRVYDHAARASDSDGKYKVVEKLEADQLTDKLLGRILGAEKRGKVHLLRLEAGAETAKLAQSKLLKERQVCHLLLTVSAMTDAELAVFVQKMEQNYKYSLYAINPLRAGAGGGEEEANGLGQGLGKEGDGEEAEEEGQEEEDIKGGKTVGRKKGGLGKEPAAAKAADQKRKYALSFIGQGCKKGQGFEEK